MAGDGCVFCSIADGTAPAHLVVADEVVAAFLDRRPVFSGHVLVVPRRHVEVLSDVPASLVGPLFGRVQAVARAVEAGLGADGTFVAVNNRVSQSVAHLHVHVVPRRFGDGLRGFFWPRSRYGSEEEMASCAARIAAAYCPPGPDG